MINEISTNDQVDVGAAPSSVPYSSFSTINLIFNAQE
jgi:hypothetical protein